MATRTNKVTIGGGAIQLDIIVRLFSSSPLTGHNRRTSEVPTISQSADDHKRRGISGPFEFDKGRNLSLAVERWSMGQIDCGAVNPRPLHSDKWE